MVTVATGALAVFLLGVAAVLALASARAIALWTVAGATALAVCAAAFAVAGARRVDACLDRADKRANSPAAIEEREKLAGELSPQAQEALRRIRGQPEAYETPIEPDAADVERCQRDTALGLHDPF